MLQGSFRGDGTPKYATAWVALTDASPDNSCLYFIPRGADPGYTAGDDCAAVASLGGGDALRACLPTAEAMQRIRAVPAAAGSAVLFSHRTFHWGSAGRRGCTAPRVAMSFGAACPSFEAPYLTGAQGTARGVAGAGVPFPRLAARLALAAAQCIAYADRFAPLPPAMLRRLRALAEADGGAHLAPGYARRIASEFVAAAKASAAAFGSSKGGAAADASESEEEGALMDEALDAMLDAEAVRFAGHLLLDSARLTRCFPARRLASAPISMTTSTMAPRAPTPPLPMRRRMKRMLKMRVKAEAAATTATALRTHRCLKLSGPPPPRASAPAAQLVWAERLGLQRKTTGRRLSATTTAQKSAVRVRRHAAVGLRPSRRARRRAKRERTS